MEYWAISFIAKDRKHPGLEPGVRQPGPQIVGTFLPGAAALSIWSTVDSPHLLQSMLMAERDPESAQFVWSCQSASSCGP